MREPIDKSQLTREQRYRIGGAEYQALDILVHLVPIYYIGTVILFGFFFRIYIACSTYAQEVLRTSNPTGPIDPWHFSFFQSLSSFNNLGIMLLDSSMVPFQNAPAPLLLTIFLILCGNTAYAINLRFIIWCLYKLTPSSRHMRREALRYLLDHPRRCYTTLFPSTQTYWLLFTLIVITLVELTSFLALNYWLPVLDGVTSGARFLDGLFQSVATRNAGFSVINLMEVNPGTQLVYIVAMYISVYPVAISMRNSNVYQVLYLFAFKKPCLFSTVLICILKLVY
ncbi:cation transporter [Cunninghamella echinulata]|nr:cation transporter [Cunninghamella echinulata]